MVRYGRVDNNQNEITRALDQIPGLSYAITSDAGEGFPDLVIGYKGVNYLIELKTKSKLTPAQVIFHNEWKGQIAICYCLDHVLIVIGIQPL